MPRTFADLVDTELGEARDAYVPLQSHHEGYGVILEELEEYWDEVRKSPRDRDPIVLLSELVQVAAMARRVAEDLGLVLRGDR